MANLAWADVPCTVEQAARFWQRVARDESAPADECWNWLPSTVHGYGRFVWRHDGRSVSMSAPRFAFLQSGGKLRDKEVVLHRCLNRRCARPSHLRSASPREASLHGDTIASDNTTKSRCPRGHLYDVEYRGARRCRTCDLDQDYQKRISAKPADMPVERWLKGANARKTKCKRDHELTPANTMVSKRGHRSCKMCHALRQRTYRLRAEAQAS